MRLVQNLISSMITVGLFSVYAGAESRPGESIFHLKGKWITSEGKAFDLSSLENKSIVLTIVYTSCKYSCPLIIEELNRIKKEVPETLAENVKYVLVSMDPLRDTPAVLKAFAAKRKLLPTDWLLLTAANEEPVRELSNVLSMTYKKGGADYAHTNLISVIGGDGVVKFSKPTLGQQLKETARAIVDSASMRPVK